MPLSDFTPEELFPRDLTKEEREDPFTVLQEINSYMHLPDMREFLSEWMKLTVTGSYNKALTRRERSDMMFTYDKVKKLVEACYIIAQKLGESDEDWKNRMRSILNIPEEIEVQDEK